MKSYIKIIFLTALVTISDLDQSKAQDIQITDQELETYWRANLKIDSISNYYRQLTTTLIKSSPLMDGGRKFNLMRDLNDNETLCNHCKISEEEQIAFKELSNEVSSARKACKESHTLILHEAGIVNYKKVSDALRENADIQQRLNNLSSSHGDLSTKTKEG